MEFRSSLAGELRQDEFLNIKNVSRDDMMAAHRVHCLDDGDYAEQCWGLGINGKRERFLSETS